MTLPLDFGIDFTTTGPAVGERFPDVVFPDQHGHVHAPSAAGYVVDGTAVLATQPY